MNMQHYYAAFCGAAWSEAQVAQELQRPSVTLCALALQVTVFIYCLHKLHLNKVSTLRTVSF